MARRKPTKADENLAQAFAADQVQAVKAYVQTLAESDPELYKVLTKTERSILIDDALGEHYVPAKAIDTTPRRNEGDRRTAPEKIAQVSNAFNNPNFRTEPFISEEDGKAYIIEDLLRNPTLITENTPADVINRAGEMYPTKVGYAEIPPSETVTDGQLEAMALAHIHQKAGLPPVIPMDVASRSASPELLEALKLAGAFETNTRALDGSRMVPISDLQYAGARRKGDRGKAGTGPEVRAVMLGDKVRNVNPVTGADLGNSFIENGVRVRPNIQGGHVISHHSTEGTPLEYLTHEPSNIGAEDARGNQGKAGDNKKGLPEDNLGALIRKVREVKGQRDLTPFVNTLMARARNERQLISEWGPLIRAVKSELQ